MTRLAAIADVHGNLPALERVLDDLAAYDLDAVIAIGDLINWGPHSVEVLERLDEIGAVMVRGNNEYYLLDYDTPRAPAHWSGYVLPAWLFEQLKGAWHHRIAAMPDAITLRYPDAPPAYVTHGRPGNPWDGVFPISTDAEIAEIMAGVGAETVLLAHTHLPIDIHSGRWHIINPGSVGVSLDGEMVARYAILEGDSDGWRATFRKIPVDNAGVIAALQTDGRGFMRMAGPEGRLVVEEFRTGRLKLHTFHVWREAERPDEPITDALVDEFLALEGDAYWKHVHPSYVLEVLERMPLL